MKDLQLWKPTRLWMKQQDRYKYVDQIAATIILEDYINRIEKNT